MIIHTNICCTLRSWYHKMCIRSKTVSPRLEDNHALKYSSNTFPYIKYMSYGKLSELHCHISMFSNRGEKVQNIRKTRGPIFPIAFLLLWPSPLELENNNTFQCSSDKFPYMVPYILCMKNCWKCILMHGCLPITGDFTRTYTNVMLPGYGSAT